MWMKTAKASPFTVQLFSALKRIGIEEATAKIEELAGLTGGDEAPTPDESDEA